MEILKTKSKITLSTLKAFAKRNKNSIYSKEKRAFDGMVDGIMPGKNNWIKSKISNDTGYYQTGIDGIYTVGSSRDYFEIYDDNKFFGISVINCCGETILTIKK